MARPLLGAAPMTPAQRAARRRQQVKKRVTQLENGLRDLIAATREAERDGVGLEALASYIITRASLTLEGHE